MSNSLQNPFSDIIGESSPVRKAVKILWGFAKNKPTTKAATPQSKSASALILTHLLGLMESVGLINCRGFHSSAITILRAVEDATDCFAAVGIDSDAAIRWQNDDLKSSDAAKIWTANRVLNGVQPLSDYRKLIRISLNQYSHCTPKQAHWNVYFESIGNKKCTMELSTEPKVININAYYIDRYLCVHIFELIEIVFIVYEDYLNRHKDMKKQLLALCIEIEKIITDFLEFIKAEKLDISRAPEISKIK